MSHLIRKYTREDTEDIKKCLVELQDFERLMDPKRLEGVRIAHEYLEHLLTLCENGNGTIFVVEINQQVVGMISIYIENDLKRFRTNYKFAYISDLIVMKEHRTDGVTKDLIDAAEEFAKSKNIDSIHASILKNHNESLSGYLRNGFQEWEIKVRKTLI